MHFKANDIYKIQKHLWEVNYMLHGIYLSVPFVKGHYMKLYI
jgi:hypothetical protein